MMKAHCPSCIHLMTPDQTADRKLLCRSYGLSASEALQDDCRRYIREPGSDDEPLHWMDGAWCVTSAAEGRGD